MRRARKPRRSLPDTGPAAASVDAGRDSVREIRKEFMTLVAQAGTAVDESISRAELANRLSRREMLGALAKSQRDVADALKHLGGAGARAPEETKEPAANATSWSSDPISVSAASIERGMSAARSSITAAIEAAAGTVSEAAKLARPSAPKSGERAAGPTE